MFSPSHRSPLSIIYVFVLSAIFASDFPIGFCCSCEKKRDDKHLPPPPTDPNVFVFFVFAVEEEEKEKEGERVQQNFDRFLLSVSTLLYLIFIAFSTYFSLSPS